MWTRMARGVELIVVLTAISGCGEGGGSGRSTSGTPATNAQTFILQPGPTGKDTAYGTVYHQTGQPDDADLSIGGWADWYYTYFEFDLTNAPPANQVLSVTLTLYFSNAGKNDPAFEVRRITQPWTEAGVSATSNPDSVLYKTFPPVTTTDFYSLDITDLYKGWKNGTWPNYGVKFAPTQNNQTNGSVASSDHADPTKRPKLVIRYDAGTSPTPTATPPSAPTNVQATALSATSVRVTWTDASSNETSFMIERVIGTGAFTAAGTVAANTTTYDDTGLAASTQYIYRVKAVNSAGSTISTNTVPVTTQAAPTTAPAAPTNLTATSVSSTQINLFWMDNAGNEDGFKVERKTGSGSFSQITTVAANTTTYTNTRLSASTQYTYRARAYNAAGDSGYSNEASATTQSASVGGTGLTALGANSQGYQKYRNNKDDSVLVYLPGGSFTMGSALGVGYGDEHPEHMVTLSAFYVGEVEVTWGQYKAYCQATSAPVPSAPSWGIIDDHPVVKVSWDDIQGYCTWAGLRLLTEAEWEYAARAGDTGNVYATSNGTISHDLANYWGKGNSGQKDQWTYTSPAASFPANAFGLYDVSGNVLEWCSDWYDGIYYASSPSTNPTGPAGPLTSRVLRGGSWFAIDTSYLRCSHRLLLLPAPPTSRDDNAGFRVARTP